MYFPFAYPDEIASSVLARATRHLGISYAMLVKQMTGREKQLMHFAVSPEVPAIARLMRMDLERVLTEHSLLPYMTAFMSDQLQSRIRENLISHNPEDSRTCGWLTHSLPFVRLHRRFCTCCTQEDEVNYGETYWHRQHILPGVFVCTKHQIPLRDTDLPSGPCAGAYSGILPGDLRGKRLELPANDDVLMAIANASHDALTGRICVHTDQGEMYSQQLVKNGFAISGGRIAAQRVQDGLANFFGTSLLAATGVAWTNTNATIERWPRSILRSGSADKFTTLKHLLLQIFLEHVGGSATSLTSIG
jgi:hypothetical protein